MPQLDITTFFNQILWLTVFFVALLPAFYLLVANPYNQLSSIRKSFPNSIKYSNIKAGIPVFNSRIQVSWLNYPVPPIESKKIKIYSNIR
jgi:hypothetical protein